MIAATAMAAAPSPGSHTCASVGGVRRAVFFAIDNNLNNDAHWRLVWCPAHFLAHRVFSERSQRPVKNACLTSLVQCGSSKWVCRTFTEQRKETMVVFGLILLIIGFVLAFKILWTIGMIFLLVGLVLWAMGALGHAVGGRRHYY